MHKSVGGQRIHIDVSVIGVGRGHRYIAVLSQTALTAMGTAYSRTLSHIRRTHWEVVHRGTLSALRRVSWAHRQVVGVI